MRPPIDRDLAARSWAAIWDIADDKPRIFGIAPDVIEHLIKLDVVETETTGLPKLTEYGWECHSIMTGGKDVYVPGLFDPDACATGCE